MKRRGFLQIGTAVFGSLTLQRYVEPAVEVDVVADWITDYGDFLVVRVPAFKSFSNETLHKPTLFLLEEQSIVRNIHVQGFVNVNASRGARITESKIDCSKMIVSRNRAIVEFSKNSHCSMSDCYLIPNKKIIMLDQYRMKIHVNV